VSEKPSDRILSKSEIVSRLLRSRAGLAGVILLLLLTLISVYAAIAVPRESYDQWNNPTFWQDYPKTVPPAWTDLPFLGSSAAKTIVLTRSDATVTESQMQGGRAVSYSWNAGYSYDSFPSRFSLTAKAEYSKLPLIQLDVTRPDGQTFTLYYSALPSVQGTGMTVTDVRIVSTDSSISSNLQNYVGQFSCDIDVAKPQVMIFSDAHDCKVLKGNYVFKVTAYFFSPSDSIREVALIFPGQVFGLMGTDDTGRDLSIGILWGAPVALFIGLSVAFASTFIGLYYGVISGFKGRYADEGMMRMNDIFYSLPALPLLIILSVTVGRSIFLFVGFFILFGWVPIAKIARSLALQITKLQYVEAAKLMGETDLRIIRRHVIPQLIPIAFATIAVAVPSAILAEAALSFLGLGDPSIPTWGRILHDANSAAAVQRGIWWWALIPGFMIALTGTAFVLIGNTLNSIVNPRSRRQTKVV
jgi:peptide/nickel transport system permease protein